MLPQLFNETLVGLIYSVLFSIALFSFLILRRVTFSVERQIRNAHTVKFPQQTLPQTFAGLIVRYYFFEFANTCNFQIRLGVL